MTEVWMFACILLGLSKIEYKPDAGPGDNLCFKHYNPQEVKIVLKITLVTGPLMRMRDALRGPRTRLIVYRF